MGEVTEAIGLWEWQPENQQDWVDDQIADFLRTNSSHAGKSMPASLLALLNESDRQRLAAAAGRARETRQPLLESLQVPGPVGLVVQIRLQGGPLPSGANNRVVAFCTCQLLPAASAESACFSGRSSAPSGEYAERDLRLLQRALEQPINGIVFADLKLSQSYLRAIFDSSPECIKVVDKDCRLIEMNQAGIRALEVDSLEQVKGIDICEWVAPEDREIFHHAVQTACAGGHSSAEFQLISAKGTRRWMEQHAVGLVFPEGIAPREQMVSVTRDVTERRRIQAELKESEQRYRQLFETMTEGFALHELIVNERNEPVDYRYLDVNPAFETIMGCRREEIVGRRHSEYSSDDREFWVQAYGQVVLSGEPLRIEYIHPKSQRQWIVLAYRTEPLQFAVLFSEVSHWRQTQAALRESDARLQLLLKYAPAGVAMLDRDLKYIAYSQRWLADYRLEGQDLLGRSHYDVFPEIPERWREIHRRCLQGAIERCERDRFERADGVITWLRWEIQPWRDAEGNIGGLVFFTEDVSKVVQAEEEVQSLRNQAAHAGRIATMGEMAAGIAHELNQPLAAISLYAEGCVTATNSGILTQPDLTAKFIEIAMLANRCGEIIRRLRAFATKRNSHRSIADLREILAASLELLKHEYRIAGVECSVTMPIDPLWLIADTIELQQVFINILRNALEATVVHPGIPPLVEVSAARVSPERCRVTVRDYGVGILPEQLSQLYTPFFTTKAKGLGMGLKISATIVRAHHGEIECKPVPGGGTEFQINLPLTLPQ